MTEEAIEHAENLRVMNSVLLAVGNDWSDVLLDAANEIDRLKAENAKLRWAVDWVAKASTDKLAVGRAKEALQEP
jgi:hypothetical protein